MSYEVYHVKFVSNLKIVVPMVVRQTKYLLCSYHILKIISRQVPYGGRFSQLPTSVFCVDVKLYDLQRIAFYIESERESFILSVIYRTARILGSMGKDNALQGLFKLRTDVGNFWIQSVVALELGSRYTDLWNSHYLKSRDHKQLQL